jgi:hypothetical protein
VLPVLAVVMFLFASPASALLGDVAAPERVENDKPDVVMIVLDELPTRSLLADDGTIDRDRHPNLAALGDDSTWYRHYTTQAPVTDAAVPSLLSGTRPTTDEPVYTDHPDSLFTLLAPTHDLNVLESATRLCP